MNKETNIFPKIELFPRIHRLVHFIFDRHVTDPQDTGGGPMLDRELYGQQELPWPEESEGIGQ